ncbi:hypothetical protein LTR85_010706 [Meristemomyces frigidus]|nr:hypothetical protein LTR85_010706 [Meristemomyces frigidus]
MALTTDIISEYSFAKSYGFLDKPGFSPEWTKVMRGAAEASMLFRYVPFLIELMKASPPWLVRLLDPNMMQLINIKLDQEAQIKAVIADRQSKNQSQKHKTIFHELLESDLPESEKTILRLAEEGQIVIAAGSSTTVHYLKSTIYFVLADPAILHRLKTELSKAMPDPSVLPPTHVLERLPYLNAVFKEGSRINDGASSRLARISPDTDLTYQQYIIPRGTSVSMSTYIQHRNQELFPDPETFNPDRWLGKDSSRLERYLVNFSKGTRGCLGINLAKAEIFLTLATVFRRFDLELFETDRSDVDAAHDFVSKAKGITHI